MHVIALADDDILHLRREEHADYQHDERYTYYIYKGGTHQWRNPTRRIAVSVEWDVTWQGDAHAGKH